MTRNASSVPKLKNPTAEQTLIHNPGYDFMRLVIWMEQIDPTQSDLPFAPYLIPAITILAACCSIEGYVNMVGQKIDPAWKEFDKGPMPVRDRITRIYDALNKEVDFGKGTWGNVLQLFSMRNDLVHPDYVKKTEKRKNEIPSLFRIAERKYPPAKCKRIADKAIDAILSDSNLTNLREQWYWRAYSGPVRERNFPTGP